MSSIDKIHVLTDEEKRRKVVAVLDIDEGSTNSIKDRFNSEMGRVRVLTENSYQKFLNTYMSPAEHLNAVDQVTATDADFYSPVVSWTVSQVDEKLVNPEKSPSDDDEGGVPPPLPVVSLSISYSPIQ